MAGTSVTIVDVLQCPHGGTVQIIPADPRVLVNGAPLATMAATFLISGCPFQLPATPPIPSPCLTVQWAAADQRTKVNGVPTVSRSSQGLCIGATGAPQGPVVIVSTQTRVQSQ